MPDRLAGRDVVTGPRRRAGVIAADTLCVADRPAAWGEPWRSTWRIGDGAGVLLVGPPGGGKSTLATQLAGSAARHVVVLYLACEEGHSVTLAERLERQQLDDLARRRLRVSDARMIAEVEEDLAAAGDARVVVIDSISELRCSPVWLTEAMRGRTWIGVVHANARGTGKYASDHEHAADVVVDVEQGVATPRKNRFGGMAPLPVWSQEVKK